MRHHKPKAESRQTRVPPTPTTIWHQLPQSSQHQLAHLVAELIQHVRLAEKDKEHDHEH